MLFARTVQPFLVTPAPAPLPVPAPAPVAAAPEEPTRAVSPHVFYSNKTKNTITSSRDVAAFFGKPHKHVLRDTRGIIATLNALGNQPVLFHERTYQDANNQARPEIIMNEEGFMLLAMGFTGKEAMVLKLEFLKEFKRVREELQRLVTPVPTYQVIDRIGKLAYYTRVDMQKHCAKELNHYMMERGGKGGTIYHHRTIMSMLMNMRPSEWRTQLMEKGLRVASFSGRDLLRRFEPAKAATAAVLDDAVRLGHKLQDIQKTDMLTTLPAAFNSILSMGLQIADDELPELAPNLLTAA